MRWIAALLFSSFFHFSNGQGIVVGAKTGIQLPDMVSAAKNWTFDLDPGVHAGINLFVYSSDLFALQTEFLLHQLKGNAKKISGSGADSVVTNLSLKLSYAEIPLMARFSFGNKVRASIFTGPSMAFLFNRSGNTNTLSYADGTPSANSTPLNTELRDFNISMNLGAALEYNNYFMEFRYGWGLTDIYRLESAQLRTRMIFISGGYVLYF